MTRSLRYRLKRSVCAVRIARDTAIRDVMRATPAQTRRRPGRFGETIEVAVDQRLDRGRRPHAVRREVGADACVTKLVPVDSGDIAAVVAHQVAWKGVTVRQHVREPIESVQGFGPVLPHRPHQAEHMGLDHQQPTSWTSDDHARRDQMPWMTHDDHSDPSSQSRRQLSLSCLLITIWPTDHRSANGKAQVPCDVSWRGYDQT